MCPKVYQTRSFNAKERTSNQVCWTVDMDNCLIKVLAEQASKGYKVDNILKTEAYNAAVAFLNERFRRCLTKGHVKNRLKTLRKHFSVLRKLLSQKGFSWDEEQKMVVADESLWRKYIKAHPNAKSFRAKSIQNYEELCVVVGNGKQPITYSTNDVENGGDWKADEEYDEINLDSEAETDDKQTKCMRWTEEMDRFLGHILVEQVKQGHKIDNSLQREAYDTALTALNGKFGLSMAKEHIRNRLKTWRKQYKILNELLSHSGFEWDGNQNMVVANDTVWNEYIKEHPEARQFLGRVVENINELWVICGNDNIERQSDCFPCSTPESQGTGAADSTCFRSFSTKEQYQYTTWTKEMDCYLGKILVDQAKEHSGADIIIKPCIFSFAAAALNKRFELDLINNQVKNRLCTWKKEYDILKKLLEHEKFRWDETYKIVLADESAWNDITKVYPDAGIFRARVVEKYDDWCIIFGKSIVFDNDLDCSLGVDVIAETADGFSIPSGEFIPSTHWESDVDMNGLREKTNFLKESEKYPVWTNEMDRLLTRELLEQVRLGNNLDGSAAYASAISVLNETFMLNLTEDIIRSRLKTWKTVYVLARECLSQNGFQWDDRRKMVTASESIWSEYIQRHPEARFLQGQSIENYDELHLIIGNDQNCGYCAEPTPISVNYANANAVNHVEQTKTPLDRVMSDEGTSHQDTMEGAQGSPERRRGQTLSSCQRGKKRRKSDSMVEMMSSMATDLRRIADTLTKNNNTVCLDELFDIVQSIPGFDDDMIIDACEYLAADDKRTRMFMRFNDRLRKKWLTKRLSGTH